MTETAVSETTELRVLACGDRNWDDRKFVFKVLDELLEERPSRKYILIEGGASGADRYAKQWAQARKIEVWSYPADWTTYGPAAGPIRNQEMLDAKPDVVLAFHDDLDKSKGTADMIQRAKKAGIPGKLLQHA